MAALILFPIGTTYLLIVFSGMGPDFRVLVRKSRKQAQQYYRLYKVYSLFVYLHIWQRHHSNKLPPVVMLCCYFPSKYAFSLLIICKCRKPSLWPSLSERLLLLCRSSRNLGMLLYEAPSYYTANEVLKLLNSVVYLLYLSKLLYKFTQSFTMPVDTSACFWY
jgi:hypothetical protein